MSYLYLFLQSNLLEWPLYLPFLVWRGRGLRWFEAAVVITLMNAVTHPLVFFGFMNLPLSYLQNILLAESFAILSEGLFLAWFLRERRLATLAVSALANLLSWQWAPILTYLAFG